MPKFERSILVVFKEALTLFLNTPSPAVSRAFISVGGFAFSCRLRGYSMAEFV